MKLSAVIGVMIASLALTAATVTEYQVRSEAMDKDVKVNVILPDSYADNDGGSYPVMYLYHGAGGNHVAWPYGLPECQKEADRFQTIIVCPDGALSWYFDSPVDPAVKYETFCGTELVAWTDANFRTVRDRNARATCGLSMGGHGAMWIAINNLDTFASAIALSGGVDIRPFPGNWGLNELLGTQDRHMANWEEHTVINAARELKDGDLAISLDCGIDDFFFQVNLDLHNQLLDQGVKHDYIVRPGAHTGEYWNNAIVYAMAFADKQFSKVR